MAVGLLSWKRVFILFWGCYQQQKYLGGLGPFQALLALCNLVFAAPGLTWTNPTDSLELFAGECAITRGELRDRVCETFLFSSSTGTTKKRPPQTTNHWRYTLFEQENIFQGLPTKTKHLNSQRQSASTEFDPSQFQPFNSLTFLGFLFASFVFLRRSATRWPWTCALEGSTTFSPTKVSATPCFRS